MAKNNSDRISLRQMGEGLIGPERKRFWRNIDELAQTDEFHRWVEDEFPHRDSLLSIDRRDFVKLMGASMLMASLAGCRRLPTETIVAYSRQPEGRTPGLEQWFASSTLLGGYATGVLIESREGRPGKVDGNPLHPASLGSSDHFMQASIYGMYDPDRAQSVTKDQGPATWTDFETETRNLLAKTPGDRVRILTGTTTSPTVSRQVSRFLAKHPGAVWTQYEPVNEDRAIAGAKLAFGAAVQPVYRLDKADVILSIDDDFLFSGPGHVRYARDFSAGRQISGPDPKMNRLYAVHAAATSTSASWISPHIRYATRITFSRYMHTN